MNFASSLKGPQITLKHVLPIALLILSGIVPACAEEGTVQPVFLICPHHKKYSSWSLYLTVDKSDPSKVLALGLDKLTGKNSVDLAPNGYEAVMVCQQDRNTPRETLGALPVGEFSRSELVVKKDDALHVSLKPQGTDSYQLFVSLRVGACGHFTIGGKDQAKRNVVLRFDRAQGKWGAYAVVLEDSEGRKLEMAGPKQMSGIVFPVSGTGIYQVAGVVDGQPVALMDR